MDQVRPLSEVAGRSAAPELTGFAERLLAVIDEGRRTATYKLAVLLAVIDCCAEGVSASGTAPAELGTRTIARRVAELYWPQLRPFLAASGPVDLRQITNKSATVIRALRSAFTALPNVSSWAAAEAILEPRVVDQVLDVVELTVARYPLVRLQTIDDVPQPFIYDIDWGEGVTIAGLRRDGGSMVRLRPGAGDQLIRLAPLVRPLVELHWVRMVAGLNELDLMEEDLHRHLFGAERVAFPANLRKELTIMQDGYSFYCTDPLSASSAIDHFVPWSRWPNDSIENLVVAHTSCNIHKSDRIPGPVPLARWTQRLGSQSKVLADAAARVRWRSDPVRTTSLARSLYAHLPEGAPVWNAPQQVAMAHPTELLSILAEL
ncbi:MAG TPA: HNH endonuclease domain-containing protein [Acidimicrobiales bacterium]|nr:HNH endonuclease domain-containing protein [Acidimicrobiales bacterium]